MLAITEMWKKICFKEDPTWQRKMSERGLMFSSIHGAIYICKNNGIYGGGHWHVKAVFY